MTPEQLVDLIEVHLEAERGYLTVYALRGDQARTERHRHAATLLEQLRREVKEASK